MSISVYDTLNLVVAMSIGEVVSGDDEHALLRHLLDKQRLHVVVGKPETTKAGLPSMVTAPLL